MFVTSSISFPNNPMTGELRVVQSRHPVVEDGLYSYQRYADMKDYLLYQTSFLAYGQLQFERQEDRAFASMWCWAFRTSEF
jgi:hypothetical protein